MNPLALNAFFNSVALKFSSGILFRGSSFLPKVRGEGKKIMKINIFKKKMMIVSWWLG